MIIALSGGDDVGMFPLAMMAASLTTTFQSFHASTIMEVCLLVVLIALTVIVLPTEQRRLALQPITFLGLGGLMFALSMLFSGIGMEGIFSFAAELLLFASVGRTSFLLILTVLQRTLKWSPQKIYLDIAMAAIYIAVLVPVLSKTGLKTSDLVTGTTVITGMTLLAMQGTLGNIFAGIAIHIHHPFDIDDWIQFDDKREHIGKVKEISWRATTVVTLDAVEVIIPNSKLAEMPLTNFMRPERFSRRSVYFVCPYSIPPARVHSTVLKAIVGSKGVLENPPPTVVTNAFTERGIEYWLRFFTEQLDIRDGIDGGVRDRIWYALDRDGITMPPATHNIEVRHVSNESQQELSTRQRELHEKILQMVSLCQDLPERAVSILAKESQLRRYLPREVIIRQNDEGSELFIVHSGTVNVSASKLDAPEVEVTALGPGDYFGEMSLLLGDRRSTTVTAATECQLLVIDKKAFAAAFAESPEVTATISRTIAARQIELTSVLGKESVAVVPDDEAKSLLAKIQNYFGII